MSFRALSLLTLTALVAAACESTPSPSPNTQSAVEAIAKEHPEVSRLSVHSVPPSGGPSIAIASTSAVKRGMVSDPEDLKAMAKNETVVIEGIGTLDVTVPICLKHGKATAAVGVTFPLKPGDRNEQLIALAQAIAQVVEDRMKSMQ